MSNHPNKNKKVCEYNFVIILTCAIVNDGEKVIRSCKSDGSPITIDTRHHVVVNSVVLVELNKN